MFFEVIDDRGKKHFVKLEQILEVKNNGKVEIFLTDGSSIITNELYKDIKDKLKILRTKKR